MPTSLTYLRRRIVDVPPEWLEPAERRRRHLTATVAERVVERQCQRAEDEAREDSE